MEGSDISQTTFGAELSKHQGPEEGRSPTPTAQANTNTVPETVAVTDGDASQPEDTTVNKVPLGTFSLASSLESVKSSTGTLSTPGESVYSMNATDYSLGPAIGFGSSAIVYYANYLPTGAPVAIKMIELDHFERNQIDELRREIQVMTLCRHPNLLRVLSSFVHQAKLWIVTPYLSGGSCLDIMKTGFREGFEEPIIATILAQALRGLDYLHKNGHIHRDFKAGNLLMDEEGAVQLADFGVSSCLSEDVDRRGVRKTFVGTPCWMAPEVMEMSGRGYDCKADIWSFGITALELAYGQAPFSRYPPMKVIYMTLSGAPPTLDRQRAKYRYSRTFKEMIDACLHKDPNKRPTAEVLLKHPFFRAARKKSFLVSEVLARVPPLQDRPRVKRLIKQVNGVGAGEGRERETSFATPEGDADKGGYADEGEDVLAPFQWEFSSDYGVRGLDEEEERTDFDSSTPGQDGLEQHNYSTGTTTDMPGLSSSTGGTLTKSSRFVVESNGRQAAEEYGGEDGENGDIARDPVQASPPENRIDEGRSTTATSTTSANPKDSALNEEDEEATIKKGRFSVLESATPTGTTDTPSSASSSPPAQPATMSASPSNVATSMPPPPPLLPPALPEECEEGRRSRFQVETTAIVMGTNGPSCLTGSPLVPQAQASTSLAPQSSAAATLTSSRFEVSTGATVAGPVMTEPSALTADSGSSSMAHPMAHPVAHLFAHTGRPYGHHSQHPHPHHHHQYHPSIYSESQSQFEYSSPSAARSSLPPPTSAVPRNGDFTPMYQYQYRSYGQYLPPSQHHHQHQHHQSAQLVGALQVHPSQIDQLLLLNELMRQQLLEIRHSPSPPPPDISWNSHVQPPPSHLSQPPHADSAHLSSTHSTMRDYARDWQRGISAASPSTLTSGNMPPPPPPPFYPSRASMYGVVDAEHDFEEDHDDPIMLPPPTAQYSTSQGVPLAATYSPHPPMGIAAGASTMATSSLLHCHKRRSFSIDHRYRQSMLSNMSGSIPSNGGGGHVINGSVPSHVQSSFASQVQTISGSQDFRLPYQQHRSVQSLKSPSYHNAQAIGGDSGPIPSGTEPPSLQANHHHPPPLHYAHHQPHPHNHHHHQHQPTPMPLSIADDVPSDRLYRGETSLDAVEIMRRQLEALQRENQQLRKQQGS